MEIKKYNSPLERDISLNKATKGRGWKVLKGQMALALAVSLWIGGGGAAYAGSEDVSIYLDADNGDALVQTAATPAGATVDQSDKTIAISGGSWNGYNKFIGGLRNSDGPMNGYTLTLSGVKLCVSADNPSWGG